MIIITIMVGEALAKMVVDDDHDHDDDDTNGDDAGDIGGDGDGGHCGCISAR